MVSAKLVGGHRVDHLAAEEVHLAGGVVVEPLDALDHPLRPGRVEEVCLLDVVEDRVLAPLRVAEPLIAGCGLDDRSLRRGLVQQPGGGSHPEPLVVLPELHLGLDHARRVEADPAGELSHRLHRRPGRAAGALRPLPGELRHHPAQALGELVGSRPRARARPSGLARGPAIAGAGRAVGAGLEGPARAGFIGNARHASALPLARRSSTAGTARPGPAAHPGSHRKEGSLRCAGPEPPAGRQSLHAPARPRNRRTAPSRARDYDAGAALSTRAFNGSAHRLEVSVTMRASSAA